MIISQRTKDLLEHLEKENKIDLNEIDLINDFKFKETLYVLKEELLELQKCDKENKDCSQVFYYVEIEVLDYDINDTSILINSLDKNGKIISYDRLLEYIKLILIKNHKYIKNNLLNEEIFDKNHFLDIKIKALYLPKRISLFDKLNSNLNLNGIIKQYKDIYNKEKKRQAFLEDVMYYEILRCNYKKRENNFFNVDKEGFSDLFTIYNIDDKGEIFYNYLENHFGDLFDSLYRLNIYTLGEYSMDVVSFFTDINKYTKEENNDIISEDILEIPFLLEKLKENIEKLIKENEYNNTEEIKRLGLKKLRNSLKDEWKYLLEYGSFKIRRG
jgi:hypothetical protein